MYSITNVGQDSYSNQKESRSSEEIIRDSFESAYRIFINELNQDERQRMSFGQPSSAQDILKVLEDTKLRYEAKHSSKARVWLNVLSSRISHYGVVLDVFVQHHPEYVSLAWGTMKFLFIAVVEHEEKTKQFSKALAEIGSILPRMSLFIGLYPTSSMMEVMARLYAKIMGFLVKAVRWYKEGSIKHAIGAVLKPWALTYKDIKEEIWELSRQVDDLAGMAVKAEIRSVHEAMLRTEQKLTVAEEQARIQIEAIRTLPNTLVLAQAPQQIQLQKLMQLALENKTLQQLTMTSQAEFFCENKRNHIISTHFFKVPTSGSSLGYCKSVRDTRKLTSTIRRSDISTLQIWPGEETSPKTLLVKSHSAEAEKDFLIDLVSLIKESGHPVIWALRYSGFWKIKISYTDILQMLLVQALEINPLALTGVSPIDLIMLREATDEGDWFRIFNRAIKEIPKLYIVVDADILGLATGHSKRQAAEWMERFTRKVSSTSIRILISSSKTDSSYIVSNWKAGCWGIIETSSLESSRLGSLRARKQRQRRAAYNRKH